MRWLSAAQRVGAAPRAALVASITHSIGNRKPGLMLRSYDPSQSSGSPLLPPLSPACLRPQPPTALPLPPRGFAALGRVGTASRHSSDFPILRSRVSAVRYLVQVFGTRCRFRSGYLCLHFCTFARGFAAVAPLHFMPEPAPDNPNPIPDHLRPETRRCLARHLPPEAATRHPKRCLSPALRSASPRVLTIAYTQSSILDTLVCHLCTFAQERRSDLHLCTVSLPLSCPRAFRPS